MQNGVLESTKEEKGGNEMNFDVNMLNVVLEKDMTDEQMNSVADAIKLLSGVLAVEVTTANVQSETIERYVTDSYKEE